MSGIKKLFGADKSQEFIKLLPNTTAKKFVIKLLILSISFFLFFLLIALGLFFIFQTNYFEDMSGNLSKFLTFAIILYGFTLIASFFIFNVSFSLLKKQYFSLPLKQVIKHVLIISISLFSFIYLVNIVQFLNDKSLATELLNIFNNPSPDSSNYVTEFFLIVFLWLLVGIAEEILFRVVFYRYLRRLLPRIIAAVLASILFSVFHPTSLILIGWINVFIIGMVYSLYYEYKNNLMTITILHFLQDIFIAGLSMYLAALTVQHFFS